MGCGSISPIHVESSQIYPSVQPAMVWLTPLICLFVCAIRVHLQTSQSNRSLFVEILHYVPTKALAESAFCDLFSCDGLFSWMMGWHSRHRLSILQLLNYLWGIWTPASYGICWSLPRYNHGFCALFSLGFGVHFHTFYLLREYVVRRSVRWLHIAAQFVRFTHSFPTQ